jgi:DNA-binding CsgD family transcriptional regulator
MKEKIIELRLNGRSYNEISKTLNCSKSMVSYHCSNLENNKLIINENQIKKSNNQKIPKITNDIIVEIKNLREKQLTIEEISEKLNLKTDSVKKVCKKYDLIFVRLGTEKKENIIKLYEIGESISSISRKLKISRFTISKYLDLFGIKKREIKKNKQNSELIQNWRIDRKIKLISYKGGKCEICGYSKSLRALQFHHLDPKEKDFSISGSSFSFEKLKKEVDKCILVCANCHSEIHDSQLENINKGM